MTSVFGGTSTINTQGIVDRISRLSRQLSNAFLRIASNEDDIQNVKWISRAVGEVVYIWDHFSGADTPPTDNANFRYVKLTSGDAYNTGTVINETVSNAGTPESIYLGTIDSSNSPLNGEIIHMINSEQSIIRPREGSSGDFQNDTVQRIQGSVGPVMSFTNSNPEDDLVSVSFDGIGTPSPGANSYRRFNIDTAGVIRTDLSYDETRVKNIGITAYLRIY